jgi:hypothetical protein
MGLDHGMTGLSFPSSTGAWRSPDFLVLLLYLPDGCWFSDEQALRTWRAAAAA